MSEISGKAVRVNVTIPERILNQIDRFAEHRGESRSGLLVSAAMEYLASESSK
jgi:metal-responsive CopG/Arc/MetJ family transcriptional regulator